MFRLLNYHQAAWKWNIQTMRHLLVKRFFQDDFYYSAVSKEDKHKALQSRRSAPDDEGEEPTKTLKHLQTSPPLQSTHERHTNTKSWRQRRRLHIHSVQRQQKGKLNRPFAGDPMIIDRLGITFNSFIRNEIKWRRHVKHKPEFRRSTLSFKVFLFNGKISRDTK